MASRSKFRRAIVAGAKIFIFSLLAILVLMTAGIICSIYRPAMAPSPYEATSPDYWPINNWETSLPQEQGMDPSKLTEMIEFYQNINTENEQNLIESITIVRNGYIVADIYLNPLFPKNTKHVIHSCTKSIISALVGIAIDKGYIANVGTPVLDILGREVSNNDDGRIEDLTVRDLLTMQTGLHSQDSYLYQWRGLFEMQHTDDWVQYALNLPFETAPGTRFDYSNMATFLLSAIITKATGMSTMSFAQEQLFDPIGIEDVKWEESPKGIHIGWARMWLKPRDMAKIGLLYLQKGKWDDVQLIPAAWIEESLIAHSSPKKYRYVYNDENKIDYMTSGGLWTFTNFARPFADGYGYQWWLDKSGMYSAIGVGGQFIMVVPKANLVVVFTSKLSSATSFLPVKMLKKFILPAIVSDEPIVVDAVDQARLDSLSTIPSGRSAPKPVPQLPDIAFEIAGKPYALEANPWRCNNFQLLFHRDQDYAEISYTAKENDRISYRIGLDDVYRFTESNQDIYAAKGSWISTNTFVIEYEVIGYSSKGKWTLSFEADDVTIEEVGVTGKYSYHGKRLLNKKKLSDRFTTNR